MSSVPKKADKFNLSLSYDFFSVASISPPEPSARGGAKAQAPKTRPIAAAPTLEYLTVDEFENVPK